MNYSLDHLKKTLSYTYKHINYSIYMAFFYYLDTKTNNLEFKKVMRRFKLEYNQKKINMFDTKYSFFKIVDLTQEE